VLGWLNAGIQLHAAEGEVDFLGPTLSLLDALHRECRASCSEIGHLKVILEADGGRRTAHLTRLDGRVAALDMSPLSARSAHLTLNARVQMPAADLEAVVRRGISALSGPTMTASTMTLRCLTPGRPEPTYRYGSPDQA